jgi:endonuclease/exonuclease/phosphatase (EEP) superfamily protein YafD
MQTQKTNIRCRDLTIVALVYLCFLFAWLAFYLLSGDRFTVIALFNFVAIYLFLPLAFVLLVAIACKNRWLGVGFLFGILALVLIWGDHFVPQEIVDTSTDPKLTVMTYNVLAWHDQYEPIIETIRVENPDVLLVQELNNGLAVILENELAQLYPYQVLAPEDNPEGIGVISKYPIKQGSVVLPQLWAGGPQILVLDWNGEQILLVNFHLTPTTGIIRLDEERSHIRAREKEAELLNILAGKTPGPIIMGGDANMPFLSDAYKILTQDLVDAYRSTGGGLGHTFPGSTLPESDRPHLGPLFLPAWLMRIDYIFHSTDWVAVSAHTAKIDGVSDHRGVVVELVINN